MKKLFSNTLSVFFQLAILLGMTVACSSSEEEVSAGKLELSVDKAEIANSIAESASFTVKYDGKDVTKICKIWNQTDMAVLEDGTFSTTEPGTYVFTASYDDMTSNEVPVKVVAEKYFKQNVLLQQITSTDCSNCPFMLHNIRSMQGSYEQDGHALLLIAYHGPLQEADPFDRFEYLSELFKPYLSNPQYPGALIQQKDLWQQQGSEEIAFILDKIYKNDSPYGIAVNSTVDGRKVTVDVDVKTLLTEDQPYRLAVVLTENNLVAPQKYGNEIDEDYVHSDVVRKHLSDVWGDPVAEGELVRGTDLKKKYSFSIPADWNIKNMDVTVYLTSESENKKERNIINVVQGKLGKELPFEYVTE